MEIQEEGKEQQKQFNATADDPTGGRNVRVSTGSRATGGSNVSMNGILVNPKTLMNAPDQKQFKSYGRISLESNLSEKMGRHSSDLCSQLIEDYIPSASMFNRNSIEEGESAASRPHDQFGWFSTQMSPLKSREEAEPTIKEEVVPVRMESMFKQNSFTIQENQPDRVPLQPPPATKVSCRCLKSKCLQLYCECFSKSLLCGPECSCYQCRNNDLFRDKLEKARDSVLTKDPEAFSNKLQIVGDIEIESKLAFKRGCNCKRTMCTKRYCECVLSSVKCSYLCKCENCMNGGPSGKPS